MVHWTIENSGNGQIIWANAQIIWFVWFGDKFFSIAHVNDQNWWTNFGHYLELLGSDRNFFKLLYQRWRSNHCWLDNYKLIKIFFGWWLNFFGHALWQPKVDNYFFFNCLVKQQEIEWPKTFGHHNWSKQKNSVSKRYCWHLSWRTKLMHLDKHWYDNGHNLGASCWFWQP